MYQKIQKSASENYPTQLQNSQLAQRSTVQAKQNSPKPVTQSGNEREFEQDRSEVSQLQLKEKSGTLTSQEQQELGVLQAKMNDSWVQRREKASQFGHDVANIPISSLHEHRGGQESSDRKSIYMVQPKGEKGKKSINREKAENTLPPYKYLIQEHKEPDSNLCAYFAYYHYTNGNVDKEQFINRAIAPYLNIMEHNDALNMFYDGNDPAVYKEFGLREASYQEALENKRLIIADVKQKGHFYALREYKGTWWNYDSYHQTTPTPIGDENAAMNYLESKNPNVWI